METTRAVNHVLSNVHRYKGGIVLLDTLVDKVVHYMYRPLNEKDRPLIENVIIRDLEKRNLYIFTRMLRSQDGSVSRKKVVMHAVYS